MSNTARSFEDVLPPAVKQHADRANEVLKALNTVPDQPPAAPTTDPNTPANPETPAAQTVDGTPPNDNPQKTDPPKSEATENWEDKFSTMKKKHDALQGKYNAEVPRLSKDVANLRSQVRALTEENTRLSKEAKEWKEKAESAAKPDTGKQPGTLNPEDYSSFGDEIVALIERVNELTEENGKLRKSLTVPPKAEIPSEPAPAATTPDPAYVAYFAKVTEGVPDIEALNTDPQLAKWLDTTTEERHGFTMRQVLNAAERRLDHTGTVKVFNFFKKDIFGIPMPTDSKEEDTPAETPTDPPPTPPLSPPPSVPPDTAGKTPTSPTGKIWTRAEIGQFYREVSAGKYNGQKELKANTEADIFAAQKEGRIQG